MGFHRGPQILKDGLVLYLDAANKKSYPGTGTIWKDLSGYGNDGIINNANFSNSYLQHSNADSSYFSITVAHSESLQNTISTVSGAWTIEEIILTESDEYPCADAGGVISKMLSSVDSTGIDWNHAIQTFEGFRTTIKHFDGTTLLRDDIIIPIPIELNDLNLWKSRTMIWNRGTNLFELYINGEFLGGDMMVNTEGKVLYDGEGIVFGTLHGWKHLGKRSIIRMYNTALTPEQIYNNFNATRSRFDL